MNSPYALAAVLAVTLIALFAMRSRSAATKLVVETVLLLLVGGCLVAQGSSPLPSHAAIMTNPHSAWLRALAVVWWLVGARLVAVLVSLARGRDARSREARLVSDLLAGAIYITAILIILNSVLDLRVNGLLATSGIIAIVLGLALQNTLADVFSGIAVGVEQPFHVGDRVSIGDHPEGIIIQMNWRAIRLQTDGDDWLTIPNSIVARSEIINRSVPTERRAASVEIPTLSTARSDRLIALVREALLLCPAILEHPTPSVTIKHAGTRITTLGVSFFVATTPDLVTAKAQLMRQVRRLFRYADGVAAHHASPAMLLADLILFEALAPRQIAELVKALVPHSYAPRDALFAQGSRGASLYVVRSGVFEIARDDPDGMRSVYGRIGAGEYIGEVSMMTGEPRPVAVVALSDAEVFELPRSAIETLIKEDASLSAALERSVQRGLALLERDVAARTCQPLDDSGTLLGRIRGFLHHR